MPALTEKPQMSGRGPGAHTGNRYTFEIAVLIGYLNTIMTTQKFLVMGYISLQSTYRNVQFGHYIIDPKSCDSLTDEHCNTFV